jgi:hypothetical protein
MINAALRFAAVLGPPVEVRLTIPQSVPVGTALVAGTQPAEDGGRRDPINRMQPITPKTAAAIVALRLTPILADSGLS